MATADNARFRITQQFEQVQESVRCTWCALVQFESELCRRCKKPLPMPPVRKAIREVPYLLKVDGRRLSPLICTTELERNAIAQALAEANEAIETAAQIGLSRAALYSEVAEIFGRQASSLRRKIRQARKETKAWGLYLVP